MPCNMVIGIFYCALSGTTYDAKKARFRDAEEDDHEGPHEGDPNRAGHREVSGRAAFWLGATRHGRSGSARPTARHRRSEATRAVRVDKETTANRIGDPMTKTPPGQGRRSRFIGGSRSARPRICTRPAASVQVRSPPP